MNFCHCLPCVTINIQGYNVVVNFFRIFKLIIFSFIVAMSDLVHDVEAIHTIKTDNSIWKPFLKYE